MYLDLDAFGQPMKLVFSLQHLLKDPTQLQALQSMWQPKNTQNSLLGRHGLVGSSTWWDGIRDGRMPLLYRVGNIEAGLAEPVAGAVNPLAVRLDDGVVHRTALYVNDRADVALFIPGRRVGIVYACDEVPNTAIGQSGLRQAHIALEMAVSLD